MDGGSELDGRLLIRSRTATERCLGQKHGAPVAWRAKSSLKYYKLAPLRGGRQPPRRRTEALLILHGFAHGLLNEI